MKRLLLMTQILALTFLYSCGNGKGEVTKTNFVFSSAIANIGGQTGGIMIFGRNNQTGQNIRFALTNEPVELENGVWNFLYASWDGLNTNLGSDGHAFEGTLRCGETLGVVLNGQETPVNMVLSVGGCSSALFGGSSTKDASGYPKPTKFYGCSNNDVFGEDSGNISDCKFSAAGSFRVFAPEKRPDGSQGLALVSRCIPNTNGAPTSELDSGTAHQIRLPILLPLIGEPLVGLSFYEDTGCSQQISETLISHFYAGEFVGQPFELEDDQNATENQVMVKIPTCNADAGNQSTPFLFDSNQFIICSRDQFNYISANAVATMTFFVDQNIDFAGEVLTNYAVDNIPTGAKVDGQGHTISGFSIVDNDTVSMGFFGTVAGEIENLNFSNVNINCTDMDMGTGVVAGLSGGGELKNISVNNVEIDSVNCDRVGGVVGHITNAGGANNENISLEDIAIDIDENSNLTGGVVGYMEAGNKALNVKVRGILIDNLGAQGTLSYNVGGVFGAVDGTNSAIVNVLATGVDIGSRSPLANKEGIGLIAGRFGDSAVAGPTVKRLKAAGTVNLGSPANYVGGIAGKSFQNPASELVAEVGFTASSSNFVGGIFGFATDDGGSTTIEDVRSFGSISCGQDCGGVIGQLTDSTSISLHGAYSEVDIDGFGADSIGGIIGDVAGANTIDSLQYDGVINAPSSDKVGGVIGNVTAGITATISNLVSYAEITGNTDVGGVVGRYNGAGGTSLSFFIGESIINSSNANTSYDIGNLAGGSVSQCNVVDVDGGGALTVANCTSEAVGALSDLSTVNAALVSATNYAGESAFFDASGSGVSELLPFYQLRELSALERLGNLDEPFQISSIDSWNIIGDSSSLMGKAFELISDIDFQSTDGVFKPIGSSTSPFQGIFKGNGHTLSNISLTEAGTEPLGIFRRIEASVSNSVYVLGYFGDREPAQKLYVDNAHFVNNGGVSAGGIGIIAGEVTDYNDGTDENPVVFDAIEITNSTVSTDSTNAAAGAGAIAGTFEFGTGSTKISQVTVRDSSVTVSNQIDGVGGAIGSITKNANIGANNAEVEAVRLDGLVITATGFNRVGGFAGNVVNDRLQVEDLIISGFSLLGNDATGGFIGAGTFSELRNAAIRDFTIFATGDSSGGIVGVKNSGGTAEIDGAYVLTSSIAANDKVGCAFGEVLTGTATIENSYFLCDTLAGTSTNYLTFGGGSVTYPTSGSVFYVGVDEVIAGTVNFPNDSFLRDPDFLTTTYPNFQNLDPWVFKDGELPVLVNEEFPQFFFID